MFILPQKVKAVKIAFKTWNKEVFGDVPNLVRATQTNLDVIQKDIATYGYSDELVGKEKEAQYQFQKP